jgi:hypothetical protein
VLSLALPERAARASGASGLRERNGEHADLLESRPVIGLDAGRTALVAIDMHRGHLDPSVATLPLPAERCGPVIARAAALFRELRVISSSASAAGPGSASSPPTAARWAT